MIYINSITAPDALGALIKVAAKHYAVAIFRTRVDGFIELSAKPLGDEGSAWLSVRCTKHNASDDEYQDAIEFLVNNVHEMRQPVVSSVNACVDNSRHKASSAST